MRRVISLFLAISIFPAITSAAAAEPNEAPVGPTQLVNPANDVILLELGPGTRSVKAAVPPGHYLLRHHLGDKAYARELDLESGKSLTLDDDALTLVARTEVRAETEHSGKFTSFVPAIVSGSLALAFGLGAAGLFIRAGDLGPIKGNPYNTIGDVCVAGAGAAALTAIVLTILPLINRS